MQFSQKIDGFSSDDWGAKLPMLHFFWKIDEKCTQTLLWLQGIRVEAEFRASMT